MTLHRTGISDWGLNSALALQTDVGLSIYLLRVCKLRGRIEYWGLFVKDISDDAKRDLIEEYTSERKPDDGGFYYKIREYQGLFGQENPYSEGRWWARFASVSGSTHKSHVSNSSLDTGNSPGYLTSFVIFPPCTPGYG